MAWNPNEPGNYAWLTKQASEHGGVNPYLSDIVDNARYETHQEDLKMFTCIAPMLVGVGILGKTAYDKIRQTIINRKEEKRQKAEEAEKQIRKAIYKANNHEIDEEG